MLKFIEIQTNYSKFVVLSVCAIELQVYLICLDSEIGTLKKPSTEKLLSKENAPQMAVNSIFKQSVSIEEASKEITINYFILQQICIL
jgi:hypothetical protein